MQTINHPIRAVFFDVDGTLYSHAANEIPESAIRALKKLQQRGIRIFIATGRHKIEIEQIDRKGIRFDGYITLSGQLCLDADFHTIYERFLPSEDLTVLKEAFLKKEVPLVFVEENEMYVNVHTEFLKEAHEKICLKVPAIKALPGNKVYQVTAFDAKERVFSIASQLQHSKCTGWNAFGSDFIPCGGGKANGIQKMLDHYSIKREETMAFGDGENDIDMLSYVMVSVAMGNASEKVKQIADHVTTDIDDRGIEQALRHYLLIE